LNWHINSLLTTSIAPTITELLQHSWLRIRYV
jgi:hypothetical protein